MHVSWAYIPIANLVGDVNQVEGGIEVVLPTPLLVNEKGEHLVKIIEIWLCVAVAMHIILDVIDIYPVHRIGLANLPRIIQSSEFCHIKTSCGIYHENIPDKTICRQSQHL